MNALVTRCETCGALVDVEDLFCANCGAEVPDARSPSDARVATGARNFQCRSCGATMNYDAAARDLKCPFCGSVDLADEGTKGVLAPDFVVPFAIDQRQAEGHLRRWLGSSFWHPDDLRSSARLTELKPVFVPFWIFTAKVRTHWTADTSRTPAGARGDWFPLNGYAEREYADLWLPAGEGISAGESFAVMPFDAAGAVPPDRVDLENVTVEQFSVSRRYARPLAQGRLEELEAEAVRREVPGNSRNVHANVLMEDATSRPALAPVYVMAYRYRDRVYRYVLNGQSGRSTGSAPTSMGKVALIAALVVVVVLIVVLLAFLH